MLFDGKQTEFQSEIHETIWAMGRHIVPFGVSTVEITDKDMLEGLKQVYDFTVELFSDMYSDPDKYQLINCSIFYEGFVNTGSIGFFHEYFYQLFKNKKAQLIGNELVVKTDELTGFLLKGFTQLDLYAPMGINYENNDGTTVIKSSKYPLFFKYYSICFEASQKRIQSFRSYIAFCDFRIFNKKFSLKIDDMARVLSDRDKAFLWELHNHLISKGIKPEPRKNYDCIQYKHKKHFLMQIYTELSIPLDIHVGLGNHPDDEIYKFMIEEIENLPNKDELVEYLIGNITYCTKCCTSARNKSCGNGQWRYFFGERRFLCQFKLSKSGFDIFFPKNENRSKYYGEHEIKIIKQILDLRIKAIDSLAS